MRRDKFLAYKRGDKITTNTWRDKLQAHKSGDTVLANQWKDETLTTR